ncbi:MULTISPECIES: prepilin-type N-terminal cleavage/methylation domain-containing protein [unclassified Nocardioides]|uniref:prepilin-type N-terminal cleavage/methylation domain-containing protein n=1 Tax=unclassified Nocardioides TaxID=2615069 RepID=UPI00070342AD|nr:MULTISPECIES: prepilin-type N-terminal cleavage/methylation domain-containing protein [unclassified Nocardioides]KRC56963.1 hypothetical protein ASE19_03950 [Nocardioides sp. Root79]KRC77172.1 hypothetical protein ASE20_02815 [Nocardioides sp. Root240]
MRRTIDRLQAARRDQRGFTLIELLIVIIILGILAAIVVFSVRGITDKGDESACKIEFRTVNTAIEAYYAENGSEAADLDALVTGGFLKGEGGVYSGKYVTGLGGTPVEATGTAC